MVTYYPEYFNNIFRVFFLRHTFLDNCSYLYLCFPKHSQYPSHFQLGSRNTTSFYLFICFLFCLMWLLWAFLSLLQFVCKWHLKSSSLIAKMKKQKNTKIYGKSHPFYSVHDMTSTNATFAKWVGKVVGKGMSFHGPSYVLQVASLSDSYLSSSELSGSRHKLLQ